MAHMASPERKALVLGRATLQAEQMEASMRLAHGANASTSAASMSGSLPSALVSGTSASRIEAAEKLKMQGNDLFGQRDYEKAAECYTAALYSLLEVPLELRSKLQAVLFSNRAACYLKLERYGDVVRDCQASLVSDSSCVKSYQRLSQALEACGDMVGALRCRVSVLELLMAEAEGRQPLVSHEAVGEVQRLRLRAFGEQPLAVEWRRLETRGRAPVRAQYSTVQWCGQVFVFGGNDRNHNLLPSDVHVFDTYKCEWSIAPIHGPRPAPRANHRAFLFDDFMFICGGNHSSELDMWRLDLRSYQWQQVLTTGCGPCGLVQHNVFVIDSKLLLWGGFPSAEHPVDKDLNKHVLYELDLVTLEWQQQPWQGDHFPAAYQDRGIGACSVMSYNSPQGRERREIVGLFGSKKRLVARSRLVMDESTAVVDRMLVDERRWVAHPSIGSDAPSARTEVAALPIPDSSATFCVGGYYEGAIRRDGCKYFDDAFLFHHDTGTWSRLQQQGDAIRPGAQYWLVRRDDGAIFMGGGFCGTPIVTMFEEVYEASLVFPGPLPPPMKLPPLVASAPLLDASLMHPTNSSSNGSHGSSPLSPFCSFSNGFPSSPLSPAAACPPLSPTATCFSAMSPLHSSSPAHSDMGFTNGRQTAGASPLHSAASMRKMPPGASPTHSAVADSSGALVVFEGRRGDDERQVEGGGREAEIEVAGARLLGMRLESETETMGTRARRMSEVLMEELRMTHPSGDVEFQFELEVPWEAQTLQFNPVLAKMEYNHRRVMGLKTTAELMAMKQPEEQRRRNQQMGRAIARTLELHIRIRSIRPAIWRRIEVSGHLSLSQLHRFVLRPIMGWGRTLHAYKFRPHSMECGEAWYGPVNSKAPDIIHAKMSGKGLADDNSIMIGELLHNVGDRMAYVYNLKEQWEHEITVIDRVLGPPDSPLTAEILDGWGSCPPEDAGGPAAYLKQLETLRFGSSSKQKAVVEKILSAPNKRRDADFDPGTFFVEAARSSLHRALSSAELVNETIETSGGGKVRGVLGTYGGVMMVPIEMCSNTTKVCRVCGALDGRVACSSCNSVWYCSTQHRKLDWKQGHRLVCKHKEEEPCTQEPHVEEA